MRGEEDEGNDEEEGEVGEELGSNNRSCCYLSANVKSSRFSSLA